MVARVTAQWTGWSGAPGYTNLHFLQSTASAQDLVDSAYAFFDAVVGTTANTFLPSGVQIQVQGDVSTFDTASGTLTGITVATPPPAIAGAGSGAWAAPTGACIAWTTNTIAAGRLIRGRTFLVPLANTGVFQTDGTLAEAFRTATLAAAADLAGAPGEFGIWHRPVGGAGGVFGTIGAFSVADKAAVLRSRRD